MAKAKFQIERRCEVWTMMVTWMKWHAMKSYLWKRLRKRCIAGGGGE